jgi:hypothetical protein
MNSTYETILTKLLTNLGCNEMCCCSSGLLEYKKVFVLRFNQRYMKLTLTGLDLTRLDSPSGFPHLLKKIETEVFEFLLTGKNEITNEILKPDSIST